MASVSELQAKLDLVLLTKTDIDKQISGGYICDLLSWVMAKGKQDMAWITVHTHLNVIAVAVLHEFACVIIPENILVPEQTLQKAEEENITVFSSSKTAYEIARGMYELGIK